MTQRQRKQTDRAAAAGQNEIKQLLVGWAEPEYQAFATRLLPGCGNMLGVRLPKLRKLAKKLAQDDWRAYLRNAEDDSFEETMLQGMVIGYASAETDELLDYVTEFIPKISNWSLCDSFCSGLKLPRKNPERFWAFLLPCFADQREYFVRFGVVMLLFYYIDKAHIRAVLSLLCSVRHEGYYAKMAVAWALSICFTKFPKLTMEYLITNTLDEFTYQKTLQKIIESQCVDADTKKRIRILKSSPRLSAPIERA